MERMDMHSRNEYAKANEYLKVLSRHDMGLSTDHPDFKDLPTESLYKLSD